MQNKFASLLVGFVLIGIGGALIYWGYNEAESFSGQIERVFSGSPSNRVMMFYLGGAACGLLGLFVTFKK